MKEARPLRRPWEGVVDARPDASHAAVAFEAGQAGGQRFLTKTGSRSRAASLNVTFISDRLSLSA